MKDILAVKRNARKKNKELEYLEEHCCLVERAGVVKLSSTVKGLQYLESPNITLFRQPVGIQRPRRHND